MIVDILEVVAWPLVALVFLALLVYPLVRRLSQALKGWLELNRRERELSAQQHEVELIERRNEAELAAATHIERTEFEQARLHAETAEQVNRAKVAEATLAAEVEARETLIAAETRSRMLLLQHKLMHEPPCNGDEEGDEDEGRYIERLAYQAYGVYREKTENPFSFNDWLNRELDDISAEAAKAYLTYVNEANEPDTFGNWQG